MILGVAVACLGRPAFAEVCDPERDQIVPRAEGVMNRAQAAYDKALAALPKAQTSGDPSAISDAQNVLTTAKGVLKKVERDLLALKEALANGRVEEACDIFQGILVAEEQLTAVDSALASIGGSGIDASVEGSDSLDVGTDDGQGSLDSGDPLSEYMGDYDSRLNDRDGYTTDTGGITGGKTGDSSSSADDVWEGSPTGSALD